jgi:hypothetical protein
MIHQTHEEYAAYCVNCKKNMHAANKKLIKKKLEISTVKRWVWLKGQFINSIIQSLGGRRVALELQQGKRDNVEEHNAWEKER